MRILRDCGGHVIPNPEVAVTQAQDKLVSDGAGGWVLTDPVAAGLVSAALEALSASIRSGVGMHLLEARRAGAEVIRKAIADRLRGF
jgi:hypothetical protein